MLKKVTGNMHIPFLRQVEGCRIALRIIRSGKSTYCVVIVVDNKYIVPSSFTYPVVENDLLKVKWFFWPFMNREFFYKDIDHIQFTSWKGPVMRIVLKNGRTKTYNGLDCMKMRDLPVFIRDLIDHGVTVDNQLKTKGKT